MGRSAEEYREFITRWIHTNHNMSVFGSEHFLEPRTQHDPGVVENESTKYSMQTESRFATRIQDSNVSR